MWHGGGNYKQYTNDATHPTPAQLALEECTNLAAVALKSRRMRGMSLGTCPRLGSISVDCGAMAQLDLRGCNQLHTLDLACPGLRTIDATFCSSLRCGSGVAAAPGGWAGLGWAGLGVPQPARCWRCRRGITHCPAHAPPPARPVQRHRHPVDGAVRRPGGPGACSVQLGWVARWQGRARCECTALCRPVPGPPLRPRCPRPTRSTTAPPSCALQ